MTKAAEFIAKLEALLTEYEASIEADYGEGTDTHGIHGEAMVVRVGRWDSRDSVTVKLCDGWDLTAREIKTHREG